MIIDYPQELKKKLLQLVSIPLNTEVAYYDSDFADLITIDVEKLYNEELVKYKTLLNKYNKIKQRFDEYNQNLENLPLADKNMTEEDYIKEIQKLEIQYSNNYAYLKQLDSRINSLKTVLATQKEKIRIQIAKDEYDINNKNENIDRQNAELKQNLLLQKTIIETCKIKLNALIFAKDEYNKQLEICEKDLDTDNSDKFKCIFCQNAVKSDKKKSEIIKNLQAKLTKIKEEIKELMLKIQEENTIITQKNKEISKIQKQISKNEDSKISPDIYLKKSQKVLKLEFRQFEIEDEIYELSKQYSSLANKEGQKYKALKNKLDSYKESLQNLIDFRNEKEELKVELKQKNELKNELDELENNIKFHLRFITIKNKIIEKRIAEMFENKVKFKLYEVDGIYLKEINKLLFNEIDVQFLNIDEQNQLERLIQNKIQYLE